MPKPQNYITWETKDEQKKAMVMYGEAIEETRSIARHRDFSDLAPNVSGRPGLTKTDYYRFRPDEAVPKKSKDILKLSNRVYKKVGIIRNVIDLMADFACQGIRISHPVARQERFYRNWFERISGKNRSERFLNTLYRLGNVVVFRSFAKPTKKQREELFSAAAEDIEIEDIKSQKFRIPLKYTFINPISVDHVDGDLAIFSDAPLLQIKFSNNFQSLMKAPGNKSSLIKRLNLSAAEINKIKNEGVLLLDPEKTEIFFYKRDDWELWSSPMIEAILDDVMVLEKMRLADMAALDGAISNIRIFKLGSLEHKIIPNAAVINRLADILENHTGVGSLDLVWGDDINLIESNTNVHEFLGEEKYRPTIQAIHSGLGIPETISGSGGGTGGFSNNFISLRTLIERLNYGRDVLTKFWTKEIKLVQKAMGFSKPAKIEFDFTNFADENAERMLWIQLADRNLISDETLQMKFKSDPEMEKIRLQREQKQRDRGARVRKAGPWFDPAFEEALKKTALQTGQVTLRQLKVDVEPRNEEDEQILNPISPKEDELGDQPGKGRPKNSRDVKQRKKREVNVQTKAVLEIWAKSAQNEIADHLCPFFLKYFKRKNLRSLTSKEAAIAENIKFGVLYHVEPLSELTKPDINKALKSGPVPQSVYSVFNDWKFKVQKDLKRELTIEEIRQVQAALYANLFTE